MTFGPLTPNEYKTKRQAPDSLETRISRGIGETLERENNRRTIRENFPKPTVTRRNTGYALDQLMDWAVFDSASEKPFNLCRVLAGSEGTLLLG